jgi:hypothetical protein
LARDHVLLLLLRLVLLVLLILLVLLLLGLLVSCPRKGRISVIFVVFLLASSLMLHHVSGTLLLLMLNLCRYWGALLCRSPPAERAPCPVG